MPTHTPSLSRAILAPLAAAAAATLLAAAPAHGQAINIDFGDAATVPPPSYAAAGWAGVWNAIPVLPPGQRFDLVGLDGASIAAKIYGIGGTVMLVANDPATSGDDEKLLDDMFVGYNAPVDLCLWLEDLVDGEYEITTYALTPNDPTLLSPVRVDSGTPGPTNVGGAWAGAHAPGLTYARHVVTTLNGKIGLHSGTYGAGGQAGVNGLQIRPMFPVGAGDVRIGAQHSRIVSAAPNPTRDAQAITIELAVSDPEVSAVEIVNIAGRVVWRSVFGPVPLPWRDPSFTLTLMWPGVDEAGRVVPAGLYFARLVGSNGASDAASGTAQRLVRL
jgi:hypothetical protein